MSDLHQSKTSSLLNRRKFSEGLSIQARATSIDTECKEISANYIVSDCILGQGTTAVVKKGICKQSGCAVAVKEIKTFEDEELCKAMRNEFELMKSLQHPHIVRVYDFCWSAKFARAFLCMQLIEGTTLQSCIKTQGKIPEETMRPLFKQLVSAVSYFHCKRIAHRDLKPDNILVQSTMDNLFVCDFGSARNLADGSLTSRVGTMLYASPETLLGQRVMGEPADIWSVGVCLYFSLSSGCTPTTGKTFSSVVAFGKYLADATLAERRAWITSIGLSRDSSVAQVLWGCLNPDPTRRPDAMLLLAHPWVLSHKDCQDYSSLLPTHSIDASDASIRSQRLCAQGFGTSDSDAGQNAGLESKKFSSNPEKKGRSAAGLLKKLCRRSLLAAGVDSEQLSTGYPGLEQKKSGEVMRKESADSMGTLPDDCPAPCLKAGLPERLPCGTTFESRRVKVLSSLPAIYSLSH